MPRRMGRPGLMGTAARTAVVVGTASHVSNNAARRNEQKAEAAQQNAAAQQQAAAAQQQAMVDQAAAQAAAQVTASQAAAAPAPMSMDDKIAKLKELGELKTAGILTDAEFDAEKAKILAL